MNHARRITLPLGIAGATALIVTGCVGDAPPGEQGASPSTASGDCAPYEKYGTFDGAEVEIYTSILDVEGERLQESWAEFEECTGITVTYEGSGEFEEQISVRVQGGNPPDLAVFPQPGLLQQVASSGKMLPAPESVAANAKEFWSEDWQSYGTVDGKLYGAPLMASIKGFIWYSPSVWEENGWAVPTTLDELDAVTETISKSDVKPWCAGFGSATGTGWPGTDWLEDYVLRTAGPEVYDQWVANEIPFDDPAIVSSLDRVGDILKNPDYVNGGFGDVSTIVSTSFQEAGFPVTEGKCAMHHQASFYEGLWPEGTKVAEDGDVWAFMTPGETADETPVTGGGEIVAAFSDADEVVAFQTYLSSPEWANSRVALGGVISANSGLDPATASSPFLQQAIEILQSDDTVFRFDGSDLMPGAVGANSFWTAMVDWISGADSATALGTVEQSWP